MKRLFFSFCSMLALSVACLAGPVSVKSGTAAVFKKAVKASLTIDYSSAKVENQTLDEYLKSRGEDFVRDWPSDQEKAKNTFVARFNKKNKKGMQLVDDSAVEYDVIIRPKTLDMGNGGSAFFSMSAKAGGVIMSGTVEVLNHQTKARVCLLDVDEVKGLGHISETMRLCLMFFELANEIYKEADDAKDEPIVEENVSPSVTTTPQATAVPAKQAEQPVKSVDVKKPATKEPASAVQPASSAQPAAASKSVAAKAQPTAKPATINGVPETVINAKSDLSLRRGEGGSFAVLKKESRVSVYIDFSNALIDNKTEEDFVRYMQTSARRKDLDEDFDENWEKKYKPQLTSTFISEANNELGDKGVSPRLVSTQGNTYTIKVVVKEINDDGDMEADYMLVGTYTGTVLAVAQLETEGGHVGRFVGLLNDGFKAAGEEFGELLGKRVKKAK